MFFSHIHRGPRPLESTQGLSSGMGTWCLLGAGGVSLRTVLGRRASCPTRAFTMESWGGWSWHICQAHWKPSILRGKGTFSWLFRSKGINQPQRNTSEARSGFLAGTVITKATGRLCVFCSLNWVGLGGWGHCSPGSSPPCFQICLVGFLWASWLPQPAFSFSFGSSFQKRIFETEPRVSKEPIKSRPLLDPR